MIKLKRAYDGPEDADGRRFLVDRLWPRGVRKADLQIDGWLKDVAPSDGLRTWFGHAPERWEAFQHRYREELCGHPAAWKPLLDAAAGGDITLVFAAKDEAHNNAVVLKQFLIEQR